MTAVTSRTDTDTPAGRRPVRGRPPRGSSNLSKAAIVDAALAEIDAHGLDGISLRSVARRLNVDAKSLYNHVEGKDGLLDAVTEHFLATLELPEATGQADADLKAFARAFRRHALAHSRATPLVLSRQTESVASMVPLEAALTLLLNVIPDHRRAVRLLRMLMATLIGAILREVDAGLTFGSTESEGVARRKAVLEGSGLPNVMAAADHIATFDRDEEFEATIDLALRAVASEIGS